ncbi:MAG: protein-glutamate O-methyltransferase CheR [Nitrospirae bacterium]|nr:MAG: protein-glutamate O-methyltransferase CheR [Nitrospirota bacterium]
MKDSDGVQFLQWALPKLHLQWPGFRKVRRQVYKRIDRRVKELGLSGVGQYRSYLDAHPEEWAALDALCWISITRFYRDKGVFQCLEGEVLERLARAAVTGGEQELRCWSIGCAAGEEPYTLAILWRLSLAPRFSALGFKILATDVDPRAIERARNGCYPGNSLKDLPAEWRAQALSPTTDGFCVKPEYREPVTFLVQDIRERAPDGPFHLILCRNVAFTYFDEALQRETLQKITERLVPGGALVIDSLESLPEGAAGFEPWAQHSGIYRKSVSLEPGQFI